MMRISIIVAAMTMITYAEAQPVQCIEDLQCAVGFYCDSTNMCHVCLNCDDLNREPAPALHPLKPIDCVKYCGACFKGLVNTYPGDVISKCGPPPFVPSHVYLIVWFTVASVMGALLLTVFIRSLLNMDKFKIVIHSSLQQLPGRRRHGRALPDTVAVSPVKYPCAA